MTILLIFAPLVFLAIQQHFRINRTEAEYGVLKTRIEKLEEELRNGR